MKTRFYLKKSTVKRFAICAAIFVFAFLLSFSNVLYNIDSISLDCLPMPQRAGGARLAIKKKRSNTVTKFREAPLLVFVLYQKIQTW
jgi:hypothetical protein